MGRLRGSSDHQTCTTDELDGRAILVRYAWSNITPTSANFEQSFSPDGGKSWETNWISDITRVKE